MNLSDLAATQTQARAVSTFTFPPGLSVKSISMAEITAEQEIQAAKRSATQAQLGFELVKEAIVALDGKPVNVGDGSADVAWRSLDAKARALTLYAYQSMHSVQEDAANAFMKSRTIEVR